MKLYQFLQYSRSAHFRLDDPPLIWLHKKFNMSWKGQRHAVIWAIFVSTGLKTLLLLFHYIWSQESQLIEVKHGWPRTTKLCVFSENLTCLMKCHRKFKKSTSVIHPYLLAETAEPIVTGNQFSTLVKCDTSM
jgi:hypothetical protein